jgi:hypothetical protein
VTAVQPLGAVDAATSAEILDRYAAGPDAFRGFVALVAFGALLRRLPATEARRVTLPTTIAMLDDPGLRQAWIDLFDAGALCEPHGALADAVRRIRL